MQNPVQQAIGNLTRTLKVIDRVESEVAEALRAARMAVEASLESIDRPIADRCVREMEESLSPVYRENLDAWESTRVRVRSEIGLLTDRL